MPTGHVNGICTSQLLRIRGFCDQHGKAGLALQSIKVWGDFDLRALYREVVEDQVISCYIALTSFDRPGFQLVDKKRATTTATACYS